MWSYLENGGKRAIGVWHRRSGKDDVALHWAATSAMQRVGNYWHMLPEASQARKAIWEAVNPHTGKRRIDEAFPLALRQTTREQEMLIRFVNGSTWQVIGSDNYDSLVGSPPIGVVFSEWALADPQAWAYIRPILRENGGWALFIYTPRGRNHGATFYEGAKGDEAWFAQKLTAEQTDVFSAEDLAQELAEYVREFGKDDGKARYLQEYFCDFNVAVVGAYYGRLMTEAEEDGRICRVPAERNQTVYTAWDLGYSDSTAIWFAQPVGRELRLVDYYEASGAPMDHYAKVLQDKPYVYAGHILPHDAEPKQITSDRSMAGSLHALGLRNLTILPQSSVADGINAARNLIPKCAFDAERCQRGIEALRQYRRQWDDRLRTFKQNPLHDWASHGADAFRYLALGLPDMVEDGLGYVDYGHYGEQGRSAVGGY